MQPGAENRPGKMKMDSNNYTGYKLFNQAENRLTSLPLLPIMYLFICDEGKSIRQFGYQRAFGRCEKAAAFGEVHPRAVRLNGFQ